MPPPPPPLPLEGGAGAAGGLLAAADGLDVTLVLVRVPLGVSGALPTLSSYNNFQSLQITQFLVIYIFHSTFGKHDNSSGNTPIQIKTGRITQTTYSSKKSYQ